MDMIVWYAFLIEANIFLTTVFLATLLASAETIRFHYHQLHNSQACVRNCCGMIWKQEAGYTTLDALISHV